MATALKPTKAARAAAPDLFGQPAYFNEPTHHQALIDQLKGLGLVAAAWALEDLQTKVEEFDELTDRVEELEAELVAAEKVSTERDALKTFFDDVVQNFEHANGSWPAAEPDDAALVAAIAEDFEKAAEARRIEEETAAPD